MPRPAAHARLNLDPFVEGYEEARRRTGHAYVGDHLPPGTHPDYPRVLAELVRVDIECRWTDGRPRPLSQYLTEFPDLRHDLALLREVAFEDYRQRVEHGEHPSAKDYASRFGIDTSDWGEEPGAVEPPADPQQMLATQVVEDEAKPPATPVHTTPPPRGSLVASSIANLEHVSGVARLYRRFHTGEAAAADSLGDRRGPANLPAEAARVFADLQASNPGIAARYAEAVSSMPIVGDSFAGFHLVDILGRGTFGCVYLARDAELADREVALKIASDLSGEPQTLARLQHTNIVPVYSYHKVDALQVVCMPYFGSVTLADVIGDLVQQKTIPGTGQHFVSTLNQRANRNSSRAPSRLPGSTISTEDETPSTTPIELGVTHEFLKKLTKYSYVEAVLWLGARIADGLGHAHDRGVIHRDLKPANILLTDEGQPMLLDFNLASNEQAAAGTAARIGGTLPYMAPEHLGAFCGQKRPVDARSDVYSLGLILFELLAGQHPFPARTGPRSEILPEMIRSREAGPPSLRTINPSVSPATEAIVRKCLDPDPNKRYPTARALQEDLDRQLNHQPLRHAPEPSRRERFRKWARRNPRLASTGSVAAVSLALILTLAGTGLALYQGRVRTEAAQQYASLRKDVAEDNVALLIGMVSPEMLGQAIEHNRTTLERYHVLSDPNWFARPLVTRLPEADQFELRRQVGDLLFLTAQAMTPTGGGSTPETTSEALRLCNLAMSCVPENERPQSYEMLHARLTGNTPMTTTQAPTTSRERLLVATELASRKRYKEVLPLVQRLVDEEPGSLAARFLLGHCYLKEEHYRDAEAQYDACTAEAPQFHWAFCMRGVARLWQSKLESARDDFSAAIALRSDIPTFYTNRALASRLLKDDSAVVADLTTAMQLGARQPRFYLLRSAAYIRLGQLEEAAADYRVGFKLPPVDDKDWTARGEARMATEPQEALADFDEALKINPTSKIALAKRKLLAPSGKNLADARAGLGSE